MIGHIHVSKLYLLCLPSTLSLLVNIVTAHPVSSQVVVTVSYGSYKTFNPYWFPGYAGRLARLQQAKELLDDQVSVNAIIILGGFYCGAGYDWENCRSDWL